MIVRTMSRRVFATGVTVAAGAAIMRNLIRAEGTPEATPSAKPAPRLLLRVHTFTSMQPELTFVSVPEFSLYDDGSVYSLGPQLAIFPPPALPNLTLTKITHEAAQSLVAAARTAGLAEPREILPPVQSADFPVTQITFSDGDEVTSISTVSGLMIIEEQPDDWDDSTWESFLALRSIASKLIGFAGTVNASGIVSAERSVDPERLQVVAFTSSNSFATASGIPNLETPALVWPVSTPLSVIAGEQAEDGGLAKSACIELTGQDVRAVIDTARDGDMHSPWVDASTTGEEVLYGVLFKPLLPDQSACYV